MPQKAEPNDYVVATGETHSIKELLELAFGYAGLNWKIHVVVDDKFCRAADIYQLRKEMRTKGDENWVKNLQSHLRI